MVPLSVKAKLGHVAPTFEGCLCKYVKERAVAVSLRGAPFVFVHRPEPHTRAFRAFHRFCLRFERFSITVRLSITVLAMREVASCCWNEMAVDNLASDGVLEEGADGVGGRGAADEVRPYTMHNSTRQL